MSLEKPTLKILTISPLITYMLIGCTNLNVNKIAYEMLRQEDCRINQLDEFCIRSYAVEYHEYELIRQEYIRSQTDSTWRVSQSDIALPTGSMVE